MPVDEFAELVANMTFARREYGEALAAHRKAAGILQDIPGTADGVLAISMANRQFSAAVQKYNKACTEFTRFVKSQRRGDLLD